MRKTLLALFSAAIIIGVIAISSQVWRFYEERYVPETTPVTIRTSSYTVPRSPAIQQPEITAKKPRAAALKTKKPHGIISDLVKFFTFSDSDSLKEWEEKIFKGRVLYKVEGQENLTYVKATSAGTASALYYKITLDTKKKNPIISWRWKVSQFPKKTMPESLEVQNEDDFAARVYVIFPAKFLLNSKVIEYVWAESLPVGSMGTSPYSNKIKLLVLKSGLNKNGGWEFEERDINADYKMLFGVMPEKSVGAIAFMTNAEHTLTNAEAMYDDITLGFKEDGISGHNGRSR